MPRLPERPNIDHLKKQARELLRPYETADPHVKTAQGVLRIASRCRTDCPTQPTH